MKRKHSINISIGSSTMLLIFVVISLVSFSVLSLSSAVTDKMFTDKTMNKSISYYNACNMAEEKLSEIDIFLAKTYSLCENEAQYFEQVSTGTTIRIPVSEYQELQVVVNFLYPTGKGATFYEIDSYSLVNVYTPELDEQLPLLK